MGGNFVPKTDLASSLGTMLKRWKNVIAQYFYGDISNCTGLTDAQIPSTITRDTELAAHTDRTDNPHSVTKSQVGLGNVTNVEQLPLSYLDTDGTMTANSDTKVPSQKAVRTYVAAHGGGGGSGSGLFSGLMSATPTQSLTGLSDWVNQGSATVTDTSAGLMIYCPSRSGDSINMLVKSVPSAPYTVTILLAFTSLFYVSYPSVEFGWRDNSTGKLHTFHWNSMSNDPGRAFSIVGWSSPTAYGTGYGNSNHSCAFVWLRLKDDGTTIYFQYSFDGVNFLTLYSVAKSSGYLGSSGYNQICFGVNGNGSAVYATIMSYAET